MIRLPIRGRTITTVKGIFSFVLASGLLLGLFYVATSPVNAYTSNEFVTVWKTNNPGTSSSTSITIPTSGGGYNYDIDWTCDGVFDVIGATGSRTNNYGVAGTYTVCIRGQFPQIYFNNAGDRQKILEVKQWGNIAWRSMLNAFSGASNLDVTATDVPNLTAVSNMSYMFTGASSLVGNPSFNNWNTTGVTNMRNLFFGATNFNQPVGNWNVASVTNMRSLFNAARAFNQPINSWNTAKATDMAYMFRNAESFDQPIGAWDVSKVVEMQYMFDGATAFNQPIASWNVTSVTDLSFMFQGATSFNQPLNGWNTANVTTIEGMFKNASAFNGAIDGWNTANLTKTDNAFHFASSFNQPINTWNMSNVVRMRSMFNTAIRFNQPVDNWDTSKVQLMTYVFRGASSFNQSLASWNVTAATSLSGEASGLTGILNESGLSVANYEATLIGWSAQNVKTGLPLGVDGLVYCSSAAQAARSTLTSAPKSWAITGDTLACPPTSISLSNNQVNEHTKPVGAITSTGINTPHTYSLVSGAGDEDNSKFTLNSTTGALAFLNGPDFENPTDLGDTAGNNTYSVRVQARNSKGLAYETSFIITVLDIDDVAPTVTIIPGTKSSTGPIEDTVIEVNDRFSIASVSVDTTSTATADNLVCSPIPGSTTSSTDFPYINDAPSPSNHLTIRCSIRITSTGRLAIRAADTSGYSSVATEVGYVIDTIGPNFSMVNVDTETNGLHNPIVHFEADDPSGVNRYEIAYKKDNNGPGVDASNTTDSVPATSNSHAIFLDPDEAQHIVEVTAYDNLGNLTVRRLVFPPTVTINAPTMASNQPINDAKVTIKTPVVGNMIDEINLTGPASDGVTLSNCKDINNNTTAPYNTKVTCDINNIHSTGMLIIEAKDVNSGAIGSNSQKFFFDNVAPTITINAPTKLKNTDIIDTTIRVDDDLSILPSGISIDDSSTATASDLVCTTSPTNELRINCTVKVTSSGNLVIKATDVSGNVTTKTEVNYVIDKVAPVVTINSSAAVTDSNQTNYNLHGSCTAGDGDVTLTVGTQPYLVNCLAGNNWSLAVDLSGYPDGTIVVSASQTDAATNNTTASANLTKDVEAPSVSVASIATNQRSPALNGSVNDPQATITVTVNGSTYNATNDGDGTWSLAAGQISPDLSDGIHGVTVVATDAHGNSETISPNNVIKVDTVRPSVTVNQATGQADPTNVDSARFSVVFSEELGENSLGPGDFVVSDSTGTVTTLTKISGTEYEAIVTGMTSGDTVKLSLPADKVSDGVGNKNTASTSTDNSVHFLTDRPTASISLASGQPTHTNTQPVQFRVVFSAVVTGFDASDITVHDSTATVTNVSTNDNQTYIVTLDGLTHGDTLNLSVADGAAQDAASNLSMPSTSSPTVYFDTVRPDVTINQAADQNDPTNVNSAKFTINFTDRLSADLTADKLTLAGTATGSVSSLTKDSDATYTATVTGMTSGNTVSLSLAENQVADRAGNQNTASTSTDNSVHYTTARPTVAISLASGQSSPTNTEPVRYQVQFSSSVSNFDASDIVVAGSSATVSNITSVDNQTYIVELTGLASGDNLTISIPENAAEDAAGNLSQASASSPTIHYETTQPSVTINQASGQADPTNANSAAFTIVLSEKPAADLTASQLTLAGTATGSITLVKNSDTNYTATVTGMADGDVVSLSMAANQFTDEAGNQNTASTSTDNQVTYDATSPSVTINQTADQADPTNVNSAKFDIIFSEPVEDFNSDKVQLSGTTGSVTALTKVSSTHWVATVTGMTSGDTVVATMPAAATKDMAGNDSLASTSADNAVSYDTTRPNVTVNQSSDQADPTNVNSAKFTIIFSKPVGGLDQSRVQISGSTSATVASITTVSPTEYTVTINSMTDGDTISLSLAEGAASDAAGNLSTASASTDNSVTYDATPPTTTITTLITNDTTPGLSGTINDAQAVITVTINGIDYTATNNGNGTWTLPDNTISPALGDGVYDVIVKATDIASNQSTNTFAGALTIDTVAPTGTANSPAPGVANSPELTGTVDDPTATIVITVNGQNYTATNNGDGTWVLPAGTITPGLPVGSHNFSVTLQDSAGNTSVTSATITVNYPPAFAPTVSQISWIGGNPIITGTFDSAATSRLTVRLNGIAYILGVDAQMSSSGDNWTLNLSGLNPPLEPGSYDIVVEAELHDGRVLSDETDAELSIVAPNIPEIITNPGAGISLGNTGVSVWLMIVSGVAVVLTGLGLIIWRSRKKRS